MTRTWVFAHFMLSVFLLAGNADQLRADPKEHGTVNAQLRDAIRFPTKSKKIVKQISNIRLFLYYLRLLARDADYLLSEAKDKETIKVELGSAIHLPMKSKKTVKHISNENPDVVLVESDFADPASVIIRGLELGFNRLELTDSDGNKEAYTVQVLTPEAFQIQKHLRAKHVTYLLRLPQQDAVGGFIGTLDYVAIYSTTEAQSDQKSRILTKKIRILLTSDESRPTSSVILEVTKEEAKKLDEVQKDGQALSLGLLASADAKEDLTIKVEADAAIQLQMKSKKPIRQVFNEKPNVAFMESGATDPAFVIIRGLKPGQSRLDLVDLDGKKETYTVQVLTPRAFQIQKNLRANYVAYSLQLPRENAVGKLIGPLDYIAIYSTKKSAPKDQKSRLLMKNIRILTLDEKEARPTCIIVVEVTHEEAKKLAESQADGEVLSLGLVASADRAEEKLLKDRKGDAERSK